MTREEWRKMKLQPNIYELYHNGWFRSIALVDQYRVVGGFHPTFELNHNTSLNEIGRFATEAEAQAVFMTLALANPA